ncbi:hypothetical protein OL548_16245 [Lysinibacillus sp. MHQ-1]|nr:hypothetical protein OL548_16245 [Lysinibacillus sp. MHQ-1]
MRKSLPFALSKDRSFFDSLGDWMGDVLYDELPEKGFECRDEQIFMAYQIEQALKEKKRTLCRSGCWNWENNSLFTSGYFLCTLYRETGTYCMC